jgi:hypothetical protein
VSAVATPSVTHIESRIARDVARHALYAIPLAVAGVGLWRGVDAAGAVALAFALVVGNFLLSAAVLGAAARRSPHLLLGAALMSFLVRFVILTAIGIGVKALDVVDWPVFCVTLIVAYFGLLAWELRSVSFSLASPGLKPPKAKATKSNPSKREREVRA